MATMRAVGVGLAVASAALTLGLWRQDAPAGGPAPRAAPAAPLAAGPGLAFRLTDADGKLMSMSVPPEVLLVGAKDGATLRARPVQTADAKTPGRVRLGLELTTPVKPGATGTYVGVMPVTLAYN